MPKDDPSLDKTRIMENGNQKIACIGWGSLIWNPENLPIVGSWMNDGPMLPVEFARESGGNRMTLVICGDARPVETYWCLMTVPDLPSAVSELAKREKIAKLIDTDIGRWRSLDDECYGAGGAQIASWAKENALDGVVWTNLPCGFKDTRNKMPSGVDVVAYLSSLQGEARDKAKEYIVKTPSQIDTLYRRLIADELGWIAA